MAWLCPTYTGCRADLPRFCLSAQRRERTPDCPSTKNRALNRSTSHRKRLIAGVLYSRFPRMSFLTMRGLRGTGPRGGGSGAIGSMEGNQSHASGLVEQSAFSAHLCDRVVGGIGGHLERRCGSTSAFEAPWPPSAPARRGQRAHRRRRQRKGAVAVRFWGAAGTGDRAGGKLAGSFDLAAERGDAFRRPAEQAGDHTIAVLFGRWPGTVAIPAGKDRIGREAAIPGGVYDQLIPGGAGRG